MGCHHGRPSRDGFPARLWRPPALLDPRSGRGRAGNLGGLLVCGGGQARRRAGFPARVDTAGAGALPPPDRGQQPFSDPAGGAGAVPGKPCPLPGRAPLARGLPAAFWLCPGAGRDLRHAAVAGNVLSGGELAPSGRDDGRQTAESAVRRGGNRPAGLRVPVGAKLAARLGGTGTPATAGTSSPQGGKPGAGKMPTARRKRLCRKEAPG